MSICCSVRKAMGADQAGVEAAEDFRGRKLVCTAVLAWARAVSLRDRTPLYSTSWENGTSRAVARRLEPSEFCSDLHISSRTV